MFKVIHREEQAHDGPIWSLGISKGLEDNNGNSYIVTGSFDDTVKAWQWADDTLALKYIFEGHALGVVSVDINHEGNIAASASLDSHIRLWDLISGNQVQSIDAGPVDSWTICFSPDSKLVATGSNSKVNMYSSETGKLETTIDTGGKFTLTLAFSPDGKTIATGAIDGMIQIFDIESEKVIKTLESHSKPVRSIAFSPDGKYLASASDDYHIKFFQVDKADPLKTISGHGSWVLCVTFSPDGKHLASSSSDKTVKIWQLGEIRKEMKKQKDIEIMEEAIALHTFKEHKDSVSCCRFNSDGTRLVSVSDDHNIVIYSTR